MAYVALLLPPHGLEAQRVIGYCRAAWSDAKHRRTHYVQVMPAPEEQQGGLAAAGAAAAAVLPSPSLADLCLRLVITPELELLVSADGGRCWVPRMAQQQLPPPEPQPAGSVEAPVQARSMASTPRPELLRPGSEQHAWAYVVAAPGQLSSLQLRRVALPALQDWQVRVQVAGVSVHFR